MLGYRHLWFVSANNACRRIQYSTSHKQFENQTSHREVYSCLVYVCMCLSPNICGSITLFCPQSLESWGFCYWAVNLGSLSFTSQCEQYVFFFKQGQCNLITVTICLIAMALASKHITTTLVDFWKQMFLYLSSQNHKWNPLIWLPCWTPSRTGTL